MVHKVCLRNCSRRCDLALHSHDIAERTSAAAFWLWGSLCRCYRQGLAVPHDMLLADCS